MLVEAYGLWVLLVHVETVRVERLDRMRKQRPADALAACGAVDEEHLKLAALDACEPKQLVVLSERDGELADAADGLAHERAHARDVVLGQEMVRGAHGAFPHRGELFAQLRRALVGGEILNARAWRDMRGVRGVCWRGPFVIAVARFRLRPALLPFVFHYAATSSISS